MTSIVRRCRVTATILIVVLCIFHLADAEGHETLTIVVSPNQNEYIIGEPVKLTVDLVNNTRSTLRIPEVDLLGYQMEFMYYEIECPDGVIERRKFEYWCKQVLLNPNYNGEPLAPGSTVRVFLYPNYTFNCDAEHSWARTFRTPGRYKISVIMYFPQSFKRLSAPVDRKIASEQVFLEFRAPSPVEMEILESLWTDKGVSLSIGDNEFSNQFDATVLRSIVDKYGQHPLAKYSKFALGKALMRTYEQAPQAEAVLIFDDLSKKHSDFRIEEVAQWRAISRYYTHDVGEANRLFEDALRSRPELRHMEPFMRYKILAEYDDMEYYTHWTRKRKEGVDLYERFAEDSDETRD